MSRYGATPFAFPDFRGATRRLILVNLVAFSVLALLRMVSSDWAMGAGEILGFIPGAFLHGSIWQPFTYSLIHFDLVGTLFELLSLWFLAGFLESMHTESWVTGLYAISVLGTSAAATLIFLCSGPLGMRLGGGILLTGCSGGIFGMLVAIGALYGDTQFLVFFIGIKARYLAVIYALISIAMLFGQERVYAFAQLGGALAGLLWVKLAPRRGVSFRLSEGWYGVRNRYYRWKRRRAARKFEVYMRQQGRTVRFDGNGRPIHEDDDEKSRWN